MRMNERILNFMKILTALLLCLLMCLTGCKQEEPGTLADAVLAEADSAEEEAEEYAPHATATPAPLKTGHIGRPVSGGSGTAYTLAQTVLAEAKGFVFRAESMSVNRYGDHILAVSWRNSTDKTYLILPGSVCVNGYCFDPMWVGTAEPNSSGTGEICFNAEDMALIGLSFCDEISFTVSVSAEDALFTEYLIRDAAVTLRPTGVTEETVACPGVAHREHEVLLLNRTGLTCLMLGPETEYDTSTYACVLLVWLENGTDTPLTFQLDAVAINGEPIDPYWAEALPPHTRAYSRIFFTREDLNEKGIAAVDALEGKLCVYHSETYETVEEADCLYYPAGTAEK